MVNKFTIENFLSMADAGKVIVLEKRRSPPFRATVSKDDKNDQYIIDRISSTGEYKGKKRINSMKALAELDRLRKGSYKFAYQI